MGKRIRAYWQALDELLSGTATRDWVRLRESTLFRSLSSSMKGLSI